MKVIDLENSRITRNLPTTFPVWSVTWNRGKQLVYGGCKASIVEFDLRTKENKPTRTIDVPGGDYQQIHSLFSKITDFFAANTKCINGLVLKIQLLRLSFHKKMVSC